MPSKPTLPCEAPEKPGDQGIAVGIEVVGERLGDGKDHGLVVKGRDQLVAGDRRVVDGIDRQRDCRHRRLQCTVARLVGERVGAEEVGARRVREPAVRVVSERTPLAGPVTSDAASVSPLASVSLPSTLPVMDVSSSPENTSATATGAAAPSPVMVIETVAMLLNARLSLCAVGEHVDAHESGVRRVGEPHPPVPASGCRCPGCRRSTGDECVAFDVRILGQGVFR